MNLQHRSYALNYSMQEMNDTQRVPSQHNCSLRIHSVSRLILSYFPSLFALISNETSKLRGTNPMFKRILHMLRHISRLYHYRLVPTQFSGPRSLSYISTADVAPDPCYQGCKLLSPLLGSGLNSIFCSKG